MVLRLEFLHASFLLLLKLQFICEYLYLLDFYLQVNWNLFHYKLLSRCCYCFSVEFLPQITTLLTDLGASQAEVSIIDGNLVHKSLKKKSVIAVNYKGSDTAGRYTSFGCRVTWHLSEPKRERLKIMWLQLFLWYLEDSPHCKFAPSWMTSPKHGMKPP